VIFGTCLLSKHINFFFQVSLHGDNDRAKRGLGGTIKKIEFCHLQVATCIGQIHVANCQPRVHSVIDPGVAKCTFYHVYSKYTLPLCHVSNYTHG
jgi:hypothetical protein